MFEASLKAKPVAKGQTVQGTIVKIGAEVALVDVGGKSEAVLDVAELRNDEGELEAKVGDRIEATVISTQGGVTLSRRLARKAATDRQIEDAFHTRLPVEGTVQGVVKGGYEVRIGHSRAFCPLSQIDIVRTVDPERARRPALHVPDRRIQRRRSQSRRLEARAARGRTGGSRRGGTPIRRAGRHPARTAWCRSRPSAPSWTSAAACRA